MRRLDAALVWDGPAKGGPRDFKAATSRRTPKAMKENATFPWPHAPVHRIDDRGVYMITAATMHRKHFYSTRQKLDGLMKELLSLSQEYKWDLEAWAVFSNHYHFVGRSDASEKERNRFFQHLHSNLARELNRLDGETGRKVWYNYWDKSLTFQESYFARLNYVHQNAVKHELVPVADQYPWCSAGWFQRTASQAQVQTIYRFKIDRVNVYDEFEPVLPEDF